MSGFYIDNQGNMDNAPDTSVGPQSDGTYAYPVVAQQNNDPSNTAGYSAATPAWVGALLSQGISTVGTYLNTKQVLDYNKYEATAGGLFRQGKPAIFARNGVTTMNSGLLWALIIGAVLLFRSK